MIVNKSWTRLFYINFISIILLSCSDGIDGTGINNGTSPSLPTPNDPIYLQGLASDGNVIVNENIFVKGSSGLIVTGTTNNEGQFKIDVQDLLAPYLLKIERPNKSELYSLTFTPGTINSHPLTDLIIRNWFAVKGYSVTSEFSNNLMPAVLPTENEINAIEVVMHKIFNLVFIELGTVSDFDIFSGLFFDDSTGFDKFLEQTNFSIMNNVINVTLQHFVLGLKNKIINNLALNIDFTLVDTIIPSTVTGLNSAAVNSSSINIFWIESIDDIAITGYNIYLNGQLHKTTPYRIFMDINLIAEQLYCYRIESFDASNNKSLLSTEKCILF